MPARGISAQASCVVEYAATLLQTVSRVHETPARFIVKVSSVVGSDAKVRAMPLLGITHTHATRACHSTMYGLYFRVYEPAVHAIHNTLYVVQKTMHKNHHQVSIRDSLWLHSGWVRMEHQILDRTLTVELVNSR
jgi:tRNA G26 N,N-dimethylase Trm1